MGEACADPGCFAAHNSDNTHYTEPVRPVFGAIDEVLFDARSIVNSAIDLLATARERAAKAEWPRPSARAASLLRAAASLLDDLGGG